MIHELLGSASQLIPGSSDRKIISVNGGILGSTASPSLPSSPCLSSSTTPAATTSTASTTAAAASSNSENQNLRCPRCDSSNTKFCYYNNYNLTQPRHFCKTCRRYWTKGGALRNVPIGGGCRKNKTVGVSNSAAKTTSAAKMKTVASELGRSGLGAAGFDHHELPANPILWGSPQNSHLLALLRANQNQNPNPSPNPISMSSGATVKEEGNLMGSHMMTEPLMVANGVLSARTRGFDHVGQAPSLGLPSSFWRNINQDQTQQQNGGFVLGEHENSGIQELYQRIRLSSANYCRDNSPLFLNNEPSSSFYSSLSILESAPASGGELGYWNPPLSWSDLPATGAYPFP